MERRQIGVVKDLFRYPVKSMLGERLSEVDIGAHGVIGDRAYALREANGRIVTAKKWTNMFEFCARYDAPPTPGALVPLSITLPDGRTMHAQDPDASAVLSAVLGRTVVLERAQSDQRHRAEIDPATVFGDVPVENVMPGHTAATLPDSFALPPGTFFDSASIHVLASGTLAHLRTLTGDDAQLDPRRFRPNIVVETAPGKEDFLEDDWLEGTLEVGGRVRIVQMRPALRCVMTTHRFIRLVYLDEDTRQVRTEAERYVRNFLDFNASAIDSLAHCKEELTATGYGFYASGVAEMLRHITYDQCVEEELCFLGTPEQVIAQIKRLDQQIGGLNEMVMISNFGGIEHWKAIKTQHLFAHYVMPALR